MANLHTFWCPLYRTKYCGGAPKLTNMRDEPRKGANWDHAWRKKATWEGNNVKGPGRRGWFKHWAPKQGGALSKKSWNFVSIDREMPPWRAAVVFSKIVLKLIENCTWKREETNVLKVKSERKPAEKKLLKIAIAEQRRQKSSFWNIETSYCFYLATFSVPKWKRAKEPTKSSHGWKIS